MFNMGGPSSQTFCGEQRSPNFFLNAQSPPNHHPPDSPQFPPWERKRHVEKQEAESAPRGKRQPPQKSTADHPRRRQQTSRTSARNQIAPLKTLRLENKSHGQKAQTHPQHAPTIRTRGPKSEESAHSRKTESASRPEARSALRGLRPHIASRGGRFQLRAQSVPGARMRERDGDVV